MPSGSAPHFPAVAGEPEEISGTFWDIGGVGGNSPGSIRDLHAALVVHLPYDHSAPAVVQEAKRCGVAAILHRSNWSDAAACIRAGMTPEAATEFLSSGADMEPVRLLAALAN